MFNIQLFSRDTTLFKSEHEKISIWFRCFFCPRSTNTTIPQTYHLPLFLPLTGGRAEACNRDRDVQTRAGGQQQGVNWDGQQISFSMEFQAHTILREGHTWLLHSSHQALLLELDFKILGRVLLIIGWSVWNALCSQWLQWSLIWCSMSTPTLLSSLLLSCDPPEHLSVSLIICSNHSSPTNPSYPAWPYTSPQ